MSAEAPEISELLQGAETWGELFFSRRQSKHDSTRVVSDFKRGFTERDSASRTWSRQEQWQAAAKAAGTLRAEGVVRGSSVVLLLPSPEEFIAAFFACQILGAIPVPLVPPWSLDRIDTHLERIAAVCRICRPQASVISGHALAALSAFSPGALQERAFGRLVDPSRFLEAEPVTELCAEVKSCDAAMVQFTSGSTSEPRGVVLSHSALLANCFGIGAGLGFWKKHHIGCSWLPLFHDMGLIGHVLVPLLWSIPNVLLPPESFALRPESWLEAVSAYGATISTAPNFAYQVCTQRLSEAKTEALDLSRWEVALCGGEPILSPTLKGFSERFEKLGFREQAFCPVYGLAEFSLAVTLSDSAAVPESEAIDRQLFSEEGSARLVEGGELRMVSSGRVIAGHEVRIVDDAEEICRAGQEGSIEARGPSLMTGYLNDAVATAQCLHDGWLVTGDRGYLRAGKLYVTGRNKELIIKGGRNLYPQEAEAAAGAVAGIRPGRVVAFGIVDEESGTDLFVLLCESHEDEEQARLLLERQVLGAVRNAVGVRPDQVRIVAPGTLSKTSSGKLQRLAVRQRYLEGDLTTPGGKGLKLAKLWLARSRQRLRGRQAYRDKI